MGTETADMIVGSALRTPDPIRRALRAYSDAGVDELILDPFFPTPTRSTSPPRLPWAERSMRETRPALRASASVGGSVVGIRGIGPRVWPVHATGDSGPLVPPH